MEHLGVYVSQQATAVSTPTVAESGIPFVAGCAPVHTAEQPAPAGVPVLATSWDDAVKQLGNSEDWNTYTLCEFMDAHFKRFSCQPVIFCNVFDPKKGAAQETKSYPVENHRATLPGTMLLDGLTVSNQSAALTADVDYTAFYDADHCIVELLPDGSAYSAAELTVTGSLAKPETVSVSDIVSGIAAVDACMNRTGMIPDLICAPGYSHLSEVAAYMAVKAGGINGLFGAKALIDIDSGADGARDVPGVLAYKTKHNLVDERQILCWPMVRLGEKRYHMSTQLAGLLAQVDAKNNGCPYESPSNKNFQMDGCCLADGTELNLTFEETNLLAGYGVVTALNFLSSGWTCRNSYTACYPGNTDVKDSFIPVSRMFDWVGNTLIRTFWSQLDKPMTARLLDTVLDTCNQWLDGLVGAGYLLGARAALLDGENPELDLMAGKIRIHIYLTPPGPAQEINFTLEYDSAYLSALTA